MTHFSKRIALLPAAMALAAPALFGTPAQADVFHKHPMASGIAAGMVAHHMAKKSHHGFAHRHPMMTGIAVGVIAHHELKKHR